MTTPTRDPAGAREGRLRHRLHEARQEIVALRAQVTAQQAALEELDRRLAKEDLARRSLELQLEHERAQLHDVTRSANEARREHTAAVARAEAGRVQAQEAAAALRARAGAEPSTSAPKAR